MSRDVNLGNRHVKIGENDAPKNDPERVIQPFPCFRDPYQ